MKLLLIASFALLLIAPQVSYAKKVYGILKVVKGTVHIQKKGKGKLKKAKVGKKVYPQDTIITGKDSRVKVVMLDDNVINVSPDSKVSIQNYEFEPKKKKKNVLLNVLYGKVRSKVNQKYDGKKNRFQIKTPSAVAGVRGTDFLVSFAGKQTQVVTFEGRVDFGLPGPGGAIQNPVSVRPGQAASNVAGRAPKAPQRVPKTKLSQMELESDADRAPSSSSEGKSEQPDKKRGKKKGKKEKGPKGDQPEANENNAPPEGGDEAGLEGDQEGEGGKRGPKKGKGKKARRGDGKGPNGPGNVNGEGPGPVAGDGEGGPRFGDDGGDKPPMEGGERDIASNDGPGPAGPAPTDGLDPYDPALGGGEGNCITCAPPPPPPNDDFLAQPGGCIGGFCGGTDGFINPDQTTINDEIVKDYNRPVFLNIILCPNGTCPQ